MLVHIISKYRWIALGIVLLPIVFYFWPKTNKVQSSSTSLKVDPIVDYWRYGKYQQQALQGCSDIPLGADFIRCHPEPLLCQLSFEKKKFAHVLHANGDLDLNFKDTFLRLKNNCHRIELKENIYSAGPRDYNQEVWSNEGQDIKIDRFYVSTYEVARWKNPDLKLTYKESIKPALTLTLKERKRFCIDRGGHLLQSHVFDAASFFPQLGNIGLLKKSFYPWSKAKRLQDDCNSFVHKDCELDSAYARVGVSWSGVFHTLGSEVEVFDNPMKPAANLKISSKYLDSKNPWHQIGLRASWTRDFDYDLTEQYLGRLESDLDIRGVAFRCMYY
ncbi:MAG: hypothetical protein VYA54_06520 [Bdellovibrionota bacterium]|nr:hypothetical protein [Bdellovibrionota bacterium]